MTNYQRGLYVLQISPLDVNRMRAKDRALLDKAANLMIEEAQAAGNNRIFSATGFDRENISIVHQQLRCTNLAWALSYTKKVRRGDVVAIIGGSFSGLMLAVALAIADDAIVYIFEKERRLLPRFLDKSHRHLSPNLNSRYLGKGFDPDWSRPFFEPPIFRWKRGVASNVAFQWLREFESYEHKLPIFTFLGYDIAKRHIKRREAGLSIDLRSRKSPRVRPINVDLLIDATGFGEEANPHELDDFSYWESGHRLIYDHLPKRCHVLVSGCGDSGLIEAMHYAIKDFRHEIVDKLWPYRRNLEAVLDIGLGKAKLDRILKREDIESYDGQVISEICWWLSTWHIPQESHGRSLRSEGAYARSIFRAIDEVLRPHLEAAYPGRDLRHLDCHLRETFAVRLPLKVQLEVRAAVRPIADAWISRHMAQLASEIPLREFLRVRELHAMARPGVTVTLNGTTPTPYTRQLATYNVWLMRILTSFPRVRYRQGKICEVKPHGRRRFKVWFNDGSTRIFDRVVTRYGLSDLKTVRMLSKRRSRDPHAGSWLLTPVSYSVPTDEPHIWKSIEPAVDRIRSKRAELEKSSGSDQSETLDKLYYTRTLVMEPNKITRTDEIYRDPQSWLSAKLQARHKLNYRSNT